MGAECCIDQKAIIIHSCSLLSMDIFGREDEFCFRKLFTQYFKMASFFNAVTGDSGFRRWEHDLQARLACEKR